jgi:dipeptidyl aminopeptidase/acylaminoacyl peptidase
MRGFPLLIVFAALLATGAFALVPTASTATTVTDIAYTDSSGSLYLTTTAATSAKALYTSDATTTLQALGIAPTGNSVLVLATSDTSQLALVPIAGGNPAAIKGTTDATSGALSPDGKTVVFATGDGIYTVPAAGGTAKQLLATPTGATDSLPVYSPNGKQVAFARDAFDADGNETTTLELFTIAEATTKDVTTGVLADLASGGRISFSPDAKTLLFAGSFDSPGLFTVPVAGGNSNQLTTDTDLWPSFSTDGTKIFFSRDAYSAGADDQQDTPVSSSDNDVDELWSIASNGNGAAVIQQGDYETVSVAAAKTISTTTTSSTTTSTTSTTTPAVPGALSVKLAVIGKRYTVTWTGSATSWKVTLQVGKKRSTTTVKGTVHSHTFTVTGKGAVTVTVAATG